MTNFIEAWRSFLGNAFNFEGRSTRAAFWWVFIGIAILGVIGSFLTQYFFSTTSENESNKITPYAFAVILSIVFILPLMSLIVRRFHDAGVSPIWLAVAASAPLINLVFVYIISSGDIEGYRALAETIFDITALALYDYTIWVSIFSVLIVCCIPSRFSKYLEYPMDDF